MEESDTFPNLLAMLRCDMPSMMARSISVRCECEQVRHRRCIGVASR
jgi:hypothetical protein